MDSAQTDQLKLDFDDGITIDFADGNSDVWINGHGDAYTITATNSIYPGPNGSPSWTFTDLSIASPPQAKLSLQGKDADIEINGESVVGMLREIRDRLNILQVSEEMEQEWDELRALREQYEAKLAECREKSRAWAALKQQG